MGMCLEQREVIDAIGEVRLFMDEWYGFNAVLTLSQQFEGQFVVNMFGLQNDQG
jgi:hypothetical protein